MVVGKHTVESKPGPDATGSTSSPGSAAVDRIYSNGIYDPLQMVPLLLDRTDEGPKWRRADDYTMNDKTRTVPAAPTA